MERERERLSLRGFKLAQIRHFFHDPREEDFTIGNGTRGTNCEINARARKFGLIE
jgi:hypothetical protein